MYFGEKRPKLELGFNWGAPRFLVILGKMSRSPVSTATSSPPQAAPGWLRSNSFVLGLFAMVLLAFLFPHPGARNGPLHPEEVSEFGIALILFMQGLSLPLEKALRGLKNWRLHVIIQTFTFVVFPLAGLLLLVIVPMVWPSEPASIKDGILYLCVLPSTISTSVVLTAVARGNTVGALFNAALSNLMGVMLTPLLVQLLMRATGRSAPIGPLLVQITLLTLVPFSVGMIVRHYVKDWVDARKPWINRISNVVILFIVYTAFCDSVNERIWDTYGVVLTLQVFVIVVLLFGGMSAIIGLTCRVLRLNHEDAIAAYFCSVKKTLAMGVPLAMLIFGKRADLSLVLLPIMFYHPLQLFVNGILANQWAKQAHATPVSQPSSNLPSVEA
jgi:sodium/bile acid cotransporter 7